MNDSVRHTVYEFEGFRLDAQRHVLFGADGQPIPLTPRLFDTLLYFVERAGQLLMKEQLLEALWPNVVVEEHNLNKIVSELRRILGEKPGEHRFIITKPGRGYCFVADVSIVTPRDTENIAPRQTPSEPALTQTSDQRRSRNQRLVGLAGFVGAVSLLGTAIGFVLFGASAPHSSGALRVTPLLFEKDGGEVPYLYASTVWKPDGTAIAYAATKGAEPAQPYVLYLYLDGSAPTPLTRSASGLPKAWTPAGHVVLSTSRSPDWAAESTGLWTVPAVGGEPEPLFAVPSGIVNNVMSVTADGSTVAALRRDEQGIWGIWAGPIAGAALERYEPAPFASAGFVNLPSLRFSPDGRLLLLMWNPAAEGEQAWLLPYPPDPEDPPRRILEALPTYLGTPLFSWLPDNRHIVVSTAEQGQPRRLYLANTESGRFRPLSDGTSTAHQLEPAVSPDGTRFVFSEIDPDGDVVTVNVHTGAVRTLLGTTRREEMPAWAANGDGFVYVTDRGGEREIWLRQDQSERPLVRPRDFPSGRTNYLIAPQLSPDGTRVMYVRVEGDDRGGATDAHLWMSSTSGGPPMRLRERAVQETPGSWSPDGDWYVYEEAANNTVALKKVRTAGTSEPDTLAAGLASRSVPVWSPDGRWILFADNGQKLIAADGSGVTRDLGAKDAVCAFARAPEELLYCIEDLTGAPKLVARTFDGTSRVIASIAPEDRPSSLVRPALRLSLTADGEGLTYSVNRGRLRLLLADGLADVPLP